MQYAAERLKQSQGNRCDDRKKDAVTAVVLINRSTQVGKSRMRRTSTSNKLGNRIFQSPQCMKVLNRRLRASTDDGCLLSQTEQTSVVRKSYGTAQNDNVV